MRHHRVNIAQRPGPSAALRSGLLGLNALAFMGVYGACGAAAQRLGVQAHVAGPWDALVPFVPWMIVPYLSSAPLLALGFLWAPQVPPLQAYSRRLLLATLLGGAVFALWPLSFDGPRPQPQAEPWHTLFAALHEMDTPHNQWPSLHVAYMVVLWGLCRAGLASRLKRAFAAAWLLAVAAATVFTHQHHLADVAGGVLLGALVCRWVPVPAEGAPPAVAWHYATGAGMALVLAAVAPHAPLGAAALWLAVCAAAVARAYARGDAGFLCKRGGRFPLRVWLLYGPYLAGYALTWQAVRWLERRHPPVHQVAPGLWVGRRLSDQEARQWLPRPCQVVDLANELTETPCLRPAALELPGGPARYHAMPLLDLQGIGPAQAAQVLQWLAAARAVGEPVFLHCAMGYSRSRVLAQQFLHSTPT